MKFNRVDNRVLLKCGLELMRANGKPLTKQSSSGGRAMLYDLPNGQSVRIRTCNDHTLVVVSDSVTINAKLNIEGTDWLLLVMPEIERVKGKVLAYLVPTDEAVKAVRDSHEKWLSSSPNTKGHNTTWNLWFGDSGSGMSGREEKYGYARKWAKFRLKGDITTEDIEDAHVDSVSEKGSVQAEVEDARQRIARAASVTVDAVKIYIDFSNCRESMIYPAA